MPRFDLRSWLRRAPKPKKLRIKTHDDDEKVIDLGDKRFRWNACEETVRAAGAKTIECLAEDGSVLRATRLTDDESEAESDDDARDKWSDKLITRERKELGALFDRYGARIVEAYHAGAEAGAIGQDRLVNLVEVLTQNLTLAITNLHNVSVNLANYIQESGAGDSGNKNDALVTTIMGALGAAQTRTTNGRSEKKGATNP